MQTEFLEQRHSLEHQEPHSSPWDHQWGLFAQKTEMSAIHAMIAAGTVDSHSSPVVAVLPQTYY